MLLLREEFREYSTYYSILKAIAQGEGSLSAISNVTGGVPRQHAAKYLHVLEQLGLVERENILFTRRGVYRVRDKVLSTWFKLIEPMVVSGIADVNEALRAIKARLDGHVATVFEELARLYIRWLSSRGLLRFDELGRFMHRGGIEINLVAVDHTSKVAHLLEVKWSELDDSDARRVARELAGKARHIPLEGYDYRLYIVARRYTGTEPPEGGTRVIDLRDMPFQQAA